MHAPFFSNQDATHICEIKKQHSCNSRVCVCVCVFFLCVFLCAWTNLSKCQFLWDSWLYGRVVSSTLQAITPNVYLWSGYECVCVWICV